MHVQPFETDSEHLTAGAGAINRSKGGKSKAAGRDGSRQIKNGQDAKGKEDPEPFTICTVWAIHAITGYL